MKRNSALLRALDVVYEQLGLPGFDQVRPAFESYIEKQRAYRPNRHRLTETQLEQVNSRLGFALDWMVYPRSAGAQPVS
jgi:hypothetical protein